MRLIIFLVLLVSSIEVSASRADPVISEFMASNKTTLADEDGDYSDWIEIYNPDATPAEMTGWFLTDKATNLTEWAFPSFALPAKAYLVIFASGKDRRVVGQPLHTNFDLKASGEYLALVKPDDLTKTTEFAPTFPAQSADISYGSCVDSGQPEVIGYFATATPGAPNDPVSQVTPPAGAQVTEPVSFLPSAGTFAAPFGLLLGGPANGQQIRYVLADPNATTGADLPEPTINSPLYTNPLVLQTSELIRAAVFDPVSGQKGPTVTAQYLLLETGATNNTSNFTSRLPLIVIDDHGSGDLPIDDPTKAYRTSLLYIFDPVNNSSLLASTPTTFTRTGLRLHGNSSQSFPKKSFRLDLWDEQDNDLPQSLLGLPADEDWELIDTWDYDNTGIYNSFIYEVSRQIGRYAPRTQMVELFANFDGGKLAYNDYYGLGALTENVKVSPDRVNITKIKSSDTTGDAVTGGYILEIDIPDPGDTTFTTNHGIPQNRFGYGEQIIVDTPSAKKITPEQLAYIKGYVQQFEDALYTDQASGFATRNYTNYIDVDSFIDYHLLNTLASNPDGFYNSEYFYKDRDGKLFMGPIWDFDRAFNSNIVAAMPGPRRWDFFGICFDYDWWGPLFQDPQFVQAWITRWFQLRQGALADTNLNSILDGLGAQVGNAAGARDAARWPDNNNGRTYHEKISDLETWLTSAAPANLGRTHWIDGQLTTSPPAPAPQITSAATVSAMANVAFTYQITNTNSAQSYAASGLPVGVNIDASKGVISGIVTQAGTYTVGLSAANPSGAGTAMLTLSVSAFQPVVTLSVTQPEVSLAGGEVSACTVTLSGPVNHDLTVTYSLAGTAVNGTDYVTLTGTKKFKAGVVSKPIKIVPQGDLGGAPSKAVRITLTSGDGYIVGSTAFGRVKISGGR